MKYWIFGAFLLVAGIVHGQDSAAGKLVAPTEAPDTIGQKTITGSDSPGL